MSYVRARQALAAMFVAALATGCGDGAAPARSDAAAAHPGEQTYTQFCFSCHASGMANAPKVGVAEHWAPRLARGRDALLTATIEGVPPGMPPRGLCASCSDQELADAIDYMIGRSQ